MKPFEKSTVRVIDAEHNIWYEEMRNNGRFVVHLEYKKHRLDFECDWNLDSRERWALIRQQFDRLVRIEDVANALEGK